MDANAMVQNALSEQLAQAAKIVENQLDAEIERLDKMDEDDYEVLRQKRLMALKKAQTQKQEWLHMGHGK